VLLAHILNLLFYDCFRWLYLITFICFYIII